ADRLQLLHRQEVRGDERKQAVGIKSLDVRTLFRKVARGQNAGLDVYDVADPLGRSLSRRGLRQLGANVRNVARPSKRMAQKIGKDVLLVSRADVVMEGFSGAEKAFS